MGKVNRQRKERTRLTLARYGKAEALRRSLFSQIGHRDASQAIAYHTIVEHWRYDGVSGRTCPRPHVVISPYA